MRRWLPESLRGQILVAVLAALALAQLVGAAITVAAREEAVRATQQGGALERVAALVFVLERTPPELHGNLLRATETPLTRLALGPVPIVSATEPGLRRAAARLSALLGDAAPRDIRMAVIEGARPPRAEPDDDDDGRAARRESRRVGRPDAERAFRRRDPQEARTMTLSLLLADGRWLNASVGFAAPERRLPALPAVSFVLGAAAIGVALWLALSRLLGPLRGLAGAAERLGRGEEPGALPVTGPSEMRALTQAFNLMQTRLQRLLADRTQMLAALGHDLRSPLTALRVRAEMVDDAETRERMLAALAEMQEMVDATLSYARGVWTAEAVESVEIGALLAAVAEDEGASFTPPPSDAALRLRPATVRRALRNLIDNARRYGGGAPEIALVVTPDAVDIAIMDRGPGIPEAELARVFDPFVRLEASRSRETGGTGLGLSIARGIVQAHGGEVSLANREGGGVVARVTLPRPAAA